MMGDHQGHSSSEGQPRASGDEPGREVVLIVEDNPQVAAFVESGLRHLGYGTVRARNGPQALRVLERSGRIDLLITDLVMPGGMNGIELAKAAVDLRPAIAVVYASGHAAPELVAEAIRISEEHFLTKPFRLSELASVVRSALLSR